MFTKPASSTSASSPREHRDHPIHEWEVGEIERRFPLEILLIPPSSSFLSPPLPSKRLTILKCPNPTREIAYCRGCTYQRKCWGSRRSVNQRKMLVCKIEDRPAGPRLQLASRGQEEISLTVQLKEHLATHPEAPIHC